MIVLVLLFNRSLGSCFAIKRNQHPMKNKNQKSIVAVNNGNQATGPTWLDAHAVKEMLKYSRSSLYRLHKKYPVKRYRLTGKIFYLKQDIDALIMEFGLIPDERHGINQAIKQPQKGRRTNSLRERSAK
jgi:hypothetical protein